MEPLKRKNVLCCLLFILFLILTERVLTLQEMHRYFIVYEYLATTQKDRRHLLYLSRICRATWFSAKKSPQGLGMASSTKLV